VEKYLPDITSIKRADKRSTNHNESSAKRKINSCRLLSLPCFFNHYIMVTNQQPRRKFMQTGIMGFCAAFFASFPKISFARSNGHKGIVVRENEGVHILTGRRKVPLTIKNFEDKKWSR
jgi:hypothetical protein